MLSRDNGKKTHVIRFTATLSKFTETGSHVEIVHSHLDFYYSRADYQSHQKCANRVPKTCDTIEIITSNNATKQPDDTG